MMRHGNRSSTITVLGATGKTGRRVVDRLVGAGVDTVAASRRSQRAFDWHEPSTWEPAIAGSDALYLVPPEDGTPVDGFMEAVAASSIRHVVLLSAHQPEQSGDGHLPSVERAVTESGRSWTIVRPTWFDQNFDEGMFAPEIEQGTLRLPVGDGREPFIDVEDIADVVTAALIDPVHAGRIYELSGPEALSFAEAVAQLAAATGRTLTFEPVEPEDFASSMREHEVPPPVIDLLLGLFAAIRAGENDHLSDGVHEALGRAPRSFAEYAARVGPTLGKR